MGSMNWLGFSLSPQELPPSSNPHHHHQDHQTRLGYNSDELSGDCYDLTSDHSSAVAAAQLIPPTPFGILEAYNRNNHHQSQDWNMKGLETNNYRTSSTSSDHIHLSMLMNNSTNNTNNQQQPKLENFLGRHSFSDHHHHHHAAAAAEYMFPTNCSSTSLHIPSSADSSNTNNNNGNGNSNNNNNNNNNNGSSIGLSMIKTWLRNQPPNLPEPAKNDGVGATTAISGDGGNTTTTTTTTQSALSLSMSSAGVQVETSSSSDVTKQQTPRTAVDSQQSRGSIEAVPRKSIDTFGQRTSIYRGVTRHRWTGRYEAHLWDNSCRREGQTRKGRQVYLGGYDKEDKAARAYDLAALKYWGTTTTTNFPISNYEKEVEEMKHMTRQEYVASLRRKSSGFSRGASIYRGVTRHHQHGRWQARIGRVAGNKDLYLGTFSTQEEAAEAYDIAAIKFRGLNAVTNFDMTRYDVKSILESATLPIGGAAKRLKDAEAAAAAADITVAAADDATIAEALGGGAHYAWPAAAAVSFNAPPPHFALHYPSNYPAAARAGGWCKQEVQDTSELNNNNNNGFAYHDLHMNTHNHNNNNVNVINTHNFFQSNSALHNLVGIDNHPHHHHHHSSYGTTPGNDYVNIPMSTSTVISTPSDQQESSTTYGSHDNDHGATVFGASSADVAYHRSLYNNYMSQAQQQQLAGGGVVVKASGGGGGGGTYDSWVPTAVPTMGVPRSNTVALSCHGAPTFTVWNDA